MTIDRRIFVVGVPRSGTTLVQSLLASHSTATSFTESHFFSRHYSWLPMTSRPVLTRNPGPRLCDFLAENGEEPPAAAGWFGARALRVRAWLPLLTRTSARRLLRVLDELAMRRGKSIWIEKTPRHLRYVPFLEKVSGGEARTDFVHVVRDGLEVVASLYRASRSWERPYDLATCVRRWNADVGFSLGRIGRPADHFVVYEELTSRPEATLARLLEELGLGWEPGVLERFGRASELLVTAEETWKEGVGRGIRRSRASARALTAEQRDQVTRSLRPGLYAQLLGKPMGDHRGAQAAPCHGPRVSVVVPFFNSERHLAACVESLLAQDEAGGPFEVILIDNGSTDGSASIARRYREVTVLEEPTPGAYAARNAGIRRARAPLIAFTDADCVVAGDWLRSIREGMRDPAVAILLGHCAYPPDASWALRLLGAYENAKAEHVIRRCAPAHHFAYANNMAVRASVFRELGPFREWKRAADSELVHRLASSRPDLRLAYCSAMRVTHMEFLRARQRARRLSLYTRTNSRIETFRELGVARRVGVLLHLLRRFLS